MKRQLRRMLGPAQLKDGRKGKGRDMIYFLEGGGLEEQKKERENGVDFRPCLALLSVGELVDAQDYLQLSGYFLSEIFTGQACKFESHEGFDYISLSIPDWNEITGDNHRIAVYYRSNLLVFVYEDEAGNDVLRRTAEAIANRGIRNLSLERILYEFFDRLTDGDSERMESIEQDIFNMEEALMTEADRDYIGRIIDLRRRLLSLKRYYEQLLDIAEAMEENQNELLSHGTVRIFRMMTNRIDRLLDSTLNLRDYVSQVREAYQAQVDIKQNEIMKLFTVITAIFLPLTLLVGWYGMNLKMPEFQWPLAYPAVILVSLIVVVGSILYFKKNKWF